MVFPSKNWSNKMTQHFLTFLFFWHFPPVCPLFLCCKKACEIEWGKKFFFCSPDVCTAPRQENSRTACYTTMLLQVKPGTRIFFHSRNLEKVFSSLPSNGGEYCGSNLNEKNTFLKKTWPSNFPPKYTDIIILLVFQSPSFASSASASSSWRHRLLSSSSASSPARPPRQTT